MGCCMGLPEVSTDVIKALILLALVELVLLGDGDVQFLLPTRLTGCSRLTPIMYDVLPAIIVIGNGGDRMDGCFQGTSWKYLQM